MVDGDKNVRVLEYSPSGGFNAFETPNNLVATNVSVLSIDGTLSQPYRNEGSLPNDAIWRPFHREAVPNIEAVPIRGEMNCKKVVMSIGN